MSLDPIGGIAEALGGLGRGIGAVFEWISQRMGLRNTPEMQKRDAARKEQEETDKDVEAIRNRDADRVSKGTS